MSLYTNCECPTCAKEFVVGDDVVVCPVCGSPHHRDCYRTVGHCGNEDYHAEGRQWEAPKQEEQQQEVVDRRICRSCGAENPAQNCFCHACGQRVTAEPQQNPQFGARAGQNPFADFAQSSNLDFGQVLDDGITVKDACDYTGPNAIPFVMKFKQVAHGTLTFNWWAFIFSFYYCFYRKMYKLGAILLGIFVIMLIPSGYFATLAVQDMVNSGLPLAFPFEFVVEGRGYAGLIVMSNISRMVSLGTMLFCGMCFNKMYYKQMLQKVRSVRTSSRHSTGSPDYSYELASRGGVNPVAIPVVLSIIFGAYMAVAFIATIFIL